REILRQLHRGHLATASLSVAPASVEEIGTISFDSSLWESRTLLFQPRATRASNNGRGSRLIEVQRRACRSQQFATGGCRGTLPGTWLCPVFRCLACFREETTASETIKR